MPIITLTTDFGTRDGYVGAVKGVMARVMGTQHWDYSRVIDIAHDIPRGDIAHAAWVVATSTPEFPRGSIHVVVVDPGVGGARQNVVVEARDQLYVGPDNGAFSLLGETSAHVITKSALLAPRISSTFHGRDIFAYVAARLASGYHPNDFGKATRLVGTLPWGPRQQGIGRVIHIDGFGNLISDLPGPEAGGAVLFEARRIPVLRTYEDVPPGEILAYVGSAGTIEIAIRDGRADGLPGAERGAKLLPDPDQTGPYR
ncbi:MAG TPA: SAM-dependent chlorinase/fluorinase [Kofleriaceae bacterium]